MKVQFIYSRTIDGSNYAPGIHEIPEVYADHWFFQSLVASKEVKVIEDDHWFFQSLIDSKEVKVIEDQIHLDEPLKRDISSVPDEAVKPEKKKGKK